MTDVESQMKKFLAVILLAALLVGVKFFYLDRSAAKEIDAQLQRTERFVSVKYKSVSRDWLSWRPRMKHVTIAPVGASSSVEVESILIRQFDKAHEIPFAMDIECNGVKTAVNDANFGAAAPDLQKMGYTEMQGVLRLNYEYQPEQKTFKLHEFRVGAENVGHLTFSLHLGNLDLNPQNLLFLLMTYPNITIQRAELRYDDDSLISRIPHLQAAKEGKSDEAIVNEWTAQLDKELAQATNEFSKDALNAVKTFVKRPKRLKIVVAPNPPISLKALERIDPRNAPQTLNMNVTS